ncbi:matrixin family metalloprotease [Blastococcus sp. CCUG 61487]|uniref:matrixin family metalloprotease n=1 Tax=Blastococcus sp. CCUG 61487 TaxID=1840703 RepID=UPI0010C1501D|nr:matrixin family metalloprotease [Blastococcus sp. CCUG 61487]TKJ28351.1 hypothetical protein A6V29_02840 [Blastococcus sp. CCUG 61487]
MDQLTPGTGDGPPPYPTVPQWVLDEAARLEAPRPARRRSPWRVPLVVLLVVVLCLGTAAFLDRDRLFAEPSGPVAASPGTGKQDLDDEASVGGGTLAPERIPGFPTPAGDASDTPLGVPLDPPPGGGPHAFLEFQTWAEAPVAYDPCRPIHYVVRPDNAPPGGAEVIRSAVERISEVTGLQFVDDGATAERPTDEREPYQPDVYGDRWAPVVIAWETVAENPDFDGERVGEAGSQWVAIGLGPHVYVTGTVSLDAEEFGVILRRGGERLARAIVLHELAHLVGLDHVDDPSQLMHPTTGDVYDFADGDLTGLAALGRGRCVPEL